MCSYCKKHDETEVPDPYYGGAQGFEKVMFDNPSFLVKAWEITQKLPDFHILDGYTGETH